MHACRGNSGTPWLTVPVSGSSLRMQGQLPASARRVVPCACRGNWIMAILGHKRIKEAEPYTRDVDKRNLPAAGIEQWARPKLVTVESWRTSWRTVANCYSTL